MTTPRSPRGYRSKGNLGEATMKLHFEKLGHTVLNGQMAESAVDLILLCCQALVEVKTQAWNALPSPKRRLCAVVGDQWRARGYLHFVVYDALKPSRQAICAGMVDNRASILFKPHGVLTHPCRGGHRTGGNEPQSPPRAESGAVETCSCPAFDDTGAPVDDLSCPIHAPPATEPEGE